MANSITKDFLDRLQTLIGKGFSLPDVISKLEWNKSAMSLVRGGKREVPVEVWERMKNVFKNETEEAATEAPTLSYLESRRAFKLNPQVELIPYHNIDIAAASSESQELYNDKSAIPEDYYYIPEFSGCRAFPVFSDSMEPKIEKGARMFLRKLEDWNEVLEYGQTYVVGLHDGRRFVKYVRKADSPNELLLVSENKAYDPFTVPKAKIRSVWLVDGWMNKATQSTYFVLKYPNNNHTIDFEDYEMGYGKHKGKKFKDIPHAYWRWMYDAGKLEGDALKYVEENVPDIAHMVKKRKQ